MLTDRYTFWLACINVYKGQKRRDGMTRQRMKVRERGKKHKKQSCLFLWVCLCLWVCVYVRNSVTLCMCECVKTVQHSHPAHIAPGLYPSNCRSQSDIVLLWLLSMVLHISPEMTKSLGQCPWPPASLLVLLHSHSLMWPWTGIGHQPHSRDWYRLCCSHAYRSAELSGQLVFVWLSVCVSRPLSSTEMGRHYKCNNLEKISPSSYWVWARAEEKNSSSPKNVMRKCPAAVHPHNCRKNHKPIFSRTGFQLRYTYSLMVCVLLCYHA